MKQAYRKLSLVITFAGLAVISGVCWHSILKKFIILNHSFQSNLRFKKHITPAKIELIKIAIMCFPVLAIIGISLYLLQYYVGEKH